MLHNVYTTLFLTYAQHRIGYASPNRIARYNKSGTMNKYVSPLSARSCASERSVEIHEILWLVLTTVRCSCVFCSNEMDAALMVFVNCLGAVIMISVVGFHYLTAKPKDAEL